jgi:uncharacterized protein YqhQ
VKKTVVGGQALIEGLLMIGPEDAAIAVRKPDGEIVVEKRTLPMKSKLSKILFLRGVVNFLSQITFGVKALMFSAEFLELEEDTESAKDKTPSHMERLLSRIFGERLQEALIYFSVFTAVGFSIGLFILLPNLLAGLLPFKQHTTGGVIAYNLFEGILRLGIFFTYLWFASRLEEIKRVWMYHGAEHKTIHCYEHEEELTVDNVRKYTTKHPRCGTSFLFIVLLVSIILFSFLGWHSIWLNLLIRLLLIPVVAGVSYELFRWAGRSESPVTHIINQPGLAFQALTTKEPDDDMIEVAITAFQNVKVANDNW